jgi:hypothetical protein
MFSTKLWLKPRSGNKINRILLTLKTKLKVNS